MTRMHADELAVDERLVHALLAEQFPQWADLPLDRVPNEGTVNALYRLGDGMAVRLPRRRGYEVEGDLETRWLPVLAPQLPVEIPLPVARGGPGAGYPLSWSIHTWVDGEYPEGPVPTDDLVALIAALQQIDPTDGPEPAYGRGKPLALRDEPVRDALQRVEAPGAVQLWEEAMRAPEWERERVWLHADLDARNVLVRDGRLTGVIDWGGTGIGDPAVDLMVAWKLVAREERKRFRELLAVDDATWLRAQGWALSQALIALGYYTMETNPTLVREARAWLEAVLG